MTQAPAKPAADLAPFRRAILRGLAVILPPLLTVVVFIWTWTIIDGHILVPCERVAGRVIVWSIRDVRSLPPQGAVEQPATADAPAQFTTDSQVYVRLDGGKWIPQAVWAKVRDNPGAIPPATPDSYYDRFVRIQYLRRELTVPIFLALFLLGLYLTGKFVAAGVGRFIWRVGEGIVHRMPIVRNVYSAVKQITDYLFSEEEVQFLRVVAVEYPRKGMWQIAFVTGESFKDIRDLAGEPVLSLLVSHSPIPATGFTCTALKRDTIELNITVDQAIQYIVSCGVVVPPHQQWSTNKEVGEGIRRQVLELDDEANRMASSA